MAGGEAERNVITVGIVDDEHVFRLGLEQLLGDSRRFQVTASVTSAGNFEAVDSAPEVVLVELYLGGVLPDFHTIARVAARSRVITMSRRFRRADAVNAVHAGAYAILTKQASGEDIRGAVEAVARGAVHLPRELVTAMPQRRPAGLSPREREALGHVAHGLTHAQAAARMGVTVSTFNTHIRRIREKLGVGNKAHLTRTALEFGLAN